MLAYSVMHDHDKSPPCRKFRLFIQLLGGYSDDLKLESTVIQMTEIFCHDR